MWWIADPLDLHRVEDRVSTVYVERCHVDRSDNAVIFVNRERTVRVPAAFIGAVLLGPGTRVTQAAVRLLADSGTSICWVGEHAVRMYAAGLGPSRGSQLIMRQAYLVTRIPERLRVARAMYAMRFPGEDVSAATMQQLRGREGARVKRIYRENAQRTGVPWDARRYKHGEPGASDEVNLLLSMGNSCLYAACHAAIVGVGASSDSCTPESHCPSSWTSRTSIRPNIRFRLPLTSSRRAGPTNQICATRCGIGFRTADSWRG